MHRNERNTASPATPGSGWGFVRPGLVRALLLLCATTGDVSAGEISGPELYVNIETTVREITLDGMERRLELLAAPEVDRAALRAADADTREEVEIVYEIWGVTPAQHAAWGSRNAERIEEWLERHPDWAREYEELEARFESLSSQFNRVRK